MRKKSVTAAVMVLVLALGALVANAAIGDKKIRTRIEEQQRRIDHGVKTGLLTPHEAKIVQDNLNRIRAAEAKMAADGIVVPKEKRRLEQMLDKNSKMIEREKHNPIRRID